GLVESNRSFRSKVRPRTQEERAQKRGGGRVLAASALPDAGDDPVFANVLSREPDPAFAAEVADTCRQLLGGAGDLLRAVPVAKLEAIPTRRSAPGSASRCPPSSASCNGFAPCGENARLGDGFGGRKRSNQAERSDTFREARHDAGTVLRRLEPGPAGADR